MYMLFLLRRNNVLIYDIKSQTINQTILCHVRAQRKKIDSTLYAHASIYNTTMLNNFNFQH